MYYDLSTIKGRILFDVKAREYGYLYASQLPEEKLIDDIFILEELAESDWEDNVGKFVNQVSDIREAKRSWIGRWIFGFRECAGWIKL